MSTYCLDESIPTRLPPASPPLRAAHIGRMEFQFEEVFLLPFLCLINPFTVFFLDMTVSVPVGPGRSARRRVRTAPADIVVDELLLTSSLLA